MTCLILLAPNVKREMKKYFAINKK